ncbi:uncharacterized protein N7503_011693 [Penicillium pulvis]|uniref:uncharacterized protein n=1 Tax=Penicillium pulvis TaxID=1562058 RepID=UPI002548B011|nr:uncharacterized protein N7503_011693 [Penicillium pulvis]KAJ5786481.1 hypothetical protein N7503_011693 [Penicillium pulvis]
MATFKPLVPPHILPQDDQNPKGATTIPSKSPSLSVVIRDTLTLSSWLLIGGLLQGLCLMALGPIAILPTVLTLLYRLVDHVLMSFRITRNRYMEGTIPTKYSPQIPYPDGSFGNEPSREQIVVFHLGARSNHPLGIFAPGMKGLRDSSLEMLKDMQADPEKSGLLGSTRWMKQEDAAGNEMKTVFYLRDYDSLHRFAYGELHMNGVRYWNKITKSNPHLAIYHETYVVPRGNWEAIYINCKPTGLGDTWFKFCDKEDKNSVTHGFMRPIVDASTGILRSKTGRLSMSQIQKVEEYDEVYGESGRV